MAAAEALMALAVEKQQDPAAENECSAATEDSLLHESPRPNTPPYFSPNADETSQLNLPNLERDPKEAEEDELETLEVIGVEVVEEDCNQESVEVIETDEWQEEGRSEHGICYAEAKRKMAQMRQKRRKSTSQIKTTPFVFRPCCSLPDELGGNELCVREAGHRGPHRLPDSGTRSNPQPGERIERVASTARSRGQQAQQQAQQQAPPKEPQRALQQEPQRAQPDPRGVAEEIMKRRPSSEVGNALIADVLKEYEEHMTSLKRQSGCSVGRVIDGIKIWYVPAKHQGGEWFALLPCGRKVQGKRAIMEAIKVRVVHFNDQEIAERLQFGLNVVVGEIEAVDPIVQRALRIEGSNVQQEDHFVTLPVIATPEGGKAFANMNDAELKAVVVQGQAELNEREIKKRTANVIDESRDLLRLEEAHVARMKEEADAREALLEQGEARLAQEKTALEKERTTCAAEFAEKRQKLGDAMAALRDSL